MGSASFKEKVNFLKCGAGRDPSKTCYRNAVRFLQKLLKNSAEDFSRGQYCSVNGIGGKPKQSKRKRLEFLDETAAKTLLSDNLNKSQQTRTNCETRRAHK